jgi:hypothetical protein
MKEKVVLNGKGVLLRLKLVLFQVVLVLPLKYGLQENQKNIN